MAWEHARDLVIAERRDGGKLPTEYNVVYNAGTPQEQVYKVIVLPPERVVTLNEIRKRSGLDNVGGQTINFAPAGGRCDCCGR